MLRATSNSVAGTAARSASRTALRPETISPLGFSIRAERAKYPALIVALDGVTAPRNLGAIVRSAAAFGVAGVVMTERRAAAMTASAWKSSAGAAARIPVAQVTNMARTIEDAKKMGCFVVGLDGESDVTLSEMPSISARCTSRFGNP